MRRLMALILLCCFCLCACGGNPAATTETTAVPTEPTTTQTSVLSTSATSAETTVTDATTVTTVTTVTTGTEARTTTRRTIPTGILLKTTTTKKTTTTTTTTKRTTTTTAPEEKPLRVLSIGNSYSMDAHHFLSALASHEGRKIRTVNLYHSGCSLKKHYEYWQTNEAAYQYEVNGKIDWNSHVSLLDVLASEPWDVITLQEASYASSTVTEHQHYIDELLKVIRFKCPNAKIYLHQTWAYADDYSSNTSGSMAAMWSKVKAFYERESTITGLPLIPAGEAMFAAQEALNARGLGESIHRDGSHASESWGRYLLALVWYKTLTGETPSNTFEAFDGYYIPDEEIRAMIHKVAMDTVAAYQ